MLQLVKNFKMIDRGKLYIRIGISQKNITFFMPSLIINTLENRPAEIDGVKNGRRASVLESVD